MISTPPDIHPRGRYNSVQASKALGINRTTLNRWVKQGRIIPQPQKSSPRLIYLGKDLLAIWEGKR